MLAAILGIMLALAATGEAVADWKATIFDGERSALSRDAPRR